jgi:hypothetical protein
LLVEAQTEKSTFIDLLPTTNQKGHISRISAINPEDPKLCWILRNADFKVWESANSSQVLWLFGGPPGCAMTEVSAHIAKQQASWTDGAVFYFSCSMESPVATTFAHSVLRHILNGSDHRQAKLITNTFLSTLLLKILERDQSRFQDDDSSIMTVEKILNASDGELLGALIKTVVKIKHI